MKRHSNRKAKQLKSSIESKIIGWAMTLPETQAFFRSLGKKVVTFLGYSVGYEDEKAMLATAKNVLSKYSPETALINIGATSGGVGTLYPIAKSMGFRTTGIVSSLAAENLNDISDSVDYVCFVADRQWGGKLPGSNDLSLTSQAMVTCTDVFIGIGGGEISRDELMAGKARGKPIYFYPAEISHEWLIRRARKMDLPPPESFWGAAHEIFGNKSGS